MANVLVSILVLVHVFDVADLQLPVVTVSRSTAAHRSRFFDVADLESGNSSNSCREGGVLVTIHATAIVFCVADPKIIMGMVLVPHHPRHKGEEETTHTTGRGRGKI